MIGTSFSQTMMCRCFKLMVTEKVKLGVHAQWNESSEERSRRLRLMDKRPKDGS